MEQELFGTANESTGTLLAAHWERQRLSVLTPAAGEATYVMQVRADGVRFTRWHAGAQDEAYGVVSPSKAALFAVAISQGLQPPRDLRPFGTPADHG